MRDGRQMASSKGERCVERSAIGETDAAGRYVYTNNRF